MRKNSLEGRALLLRIRREFHTARLSKSGQCYSDKVRQLALAGLKQGFLRNEIALAAGISGRSISNWRKAQQPDGVKSSIAKGVRLQLVKCRPLPHPTSREEQVSLPDTPKLPAQVAVIRLTSGVTIEMSANCITDALIATLNRSTR